MSSYAIRAATPADAEAVTAVVVGHERALYGASTFARSDLEEEWRELDLEQRVRVVLDGERVVGCGAAHDRGEVWRLSGQVHPDALGRGVGTLLSQALERIAVAGGARRVQSDAYETDAAGRALHAALGYRPVRVFRELRIELDAAPAAPVWPAGLRATSFDAERDAVEFHAAHQEAFADHWEYTPRTFEDWSVYHLTGDKFDPSLWCVVRDGDEIAAGAVNVDNLYGGGWVASLFTRRPWRGRGAGRGLLQATFGRFWEHGQRNVGLGVDAESATGAFRLYERAGMKPVLGWVMFEKAVAGA